MEKEDKYKLAEQFRRIRQFMNSVPLKTGISHNEFCLLNIIMDGKDGITVSELASILEVTPPAVSRSLRSLESRGLITRETNLLNRRNTMVRLTAEGQVFLERSRRQMDKVMDYVNEKMGEDRKKQLYELLAEMTNIIENYVKGDHADDKDS